MYYINYYALMHKMLSELIKNISSFLSNKERHKILTHYNIGKSLQKIFVRQNYSQSIKSLEKIVKVSKYLIIFY